MKKTAFVNFIFWGLGIVVVIVIFMQAFRFLGKDDMNPNSPFDHKYRVAEVLHDVTGQKNIDNLPLVYLETISKELLLMEDLGSRDWTTAGVLAYIGEEENTKGVWRITKDGANGEIYEVLVDLDDNVILSYTAGEELQWQYRLERVDTHKCIVANTGSIATIDLEWYPNGTFQEETLQIVETVDEECEISFTLDVDNVDVLTVEETYYTGNGNDTESKQYSLKKNNAGGFIMNINTRYENENQYAVYRIPYENGEYIFGIEYK